MIGIVIVSHSAKLAEGVLEIVQQMTQGRVPIAVAGGIDNPDDSLGTDPMRVLEAIDSVYSDDGVLVLMDLGSAVMSAEMALEFLPVERRDNVHLVDAPLVEGCLVAAVQASIGSPLAVVIAEARSALTSKRTSLNPAYTPDASEFDGDWHTLEIIVPNQHGFHARPAAKLIMLADDYDATLWVEHGQRRVDARSINQLVMLGARQGDPITFYASGQQAIQLLTAVAALVDDNFGDSNHDFSTVPEFQSDHPAPDTGILVGIPAAGGIAIGNVRRLIYADPVLDATLIEDVDSAFADLKRAIAAALYDLDGIIHQTNPDDVRIFEAHRLILQDPDLLEQVRDHMQQTRHNPPLAWWTVIDRTAAQYRQLQDEYLRQRAADVTDVGRRVLSHLAPDALPRQQMTQDGILVADDLAPSDTVQIDPQRVLGLVMAGGSATSHSAIIARSLGIPSVIGLGAAAQQLTSGQQIAIDGTKGWVYVHPDATQLSDLRQRQAAWHNQQQSFRASRQQTAITTDDIRIQINANIGTPTEARNALNAGAEGVGLFRTELMFMGRQTPPDEATQIAAYRQVAAVMNGQPVIIRTLDVGGDKPIPYVNIPSETNPFLGYRGIRNWLDMPELARTQLRAILRAGVGASLSIMFPMVSTLDDLLRARALLDAAKTELRAQGQSFAEDVPVGIMIEVPAAVWMADQLAEYVDFFSIGTNDLAQYVMAADRGNRHVNRLIDPFQPAVLRAIAHTTEAAHAAGIRVGMCGEMAGDPLAIPLLIGMGLTDLSMGQHAIAEAKALIRTLDSTAARTLAADALRQTSAAAVREVLSTADRR